MAYRLKTAFKPSARKKRGFETVSLNVTPIMNLVVVLIPLLLQAVVFITLGRIDYVPPPTPTDAMDEQILGENKDEDLKLLNLVVNVTGEVIEVSIFEATSGDSFWTIPYVPEVGFDFNQLQQILYNIKTNIVGEPTRVIHSTDPVSGEEIITPFYAFDDANLVRIAAVPNLDYQTIVALMDATQSIVVNGDREILFPQPILGQIASIVIG